MPGLIETAVRVIIGFAILGFITWVWSAIMAYVRKDILPDFGITPLMVGGAGRA